MKHRILYTILFTLSGALFLSSASHASTISFDVVKEVINGDGQISLYVKIDTEEKDVNAISGKLVFPPELLTLEHIDTSESAVQLWLEGPILDNDHIKFSGIIPGGFAGRADVFKLVLAPGDAGTGLIAFDELTVLLNDGKGSEDQVTSEPLEITLPLGQPPVFRAEPEDTTSPIILSAQAVTDPSGQTPRMLVIHAVDHESGIAEIKYHTEQTGWQTYTKPTDISDIPLTAAISIEVRDLAGNIASRQLYEQPETANMPINIWWMIAGLLLLIIIMTISIITLLHRHTP